MPSEKPIRFGTVSGPFGVDVVNRGRAAISVTAWWLKGNKHDLLLVPEIPSSDLPYTIEPGHSETWSVDVGEILGYLIEAHITDEVGFRACVRLATGEVRHGDEEFVFQVSEEVAAYIREKLKLSKADAKTHDEVPHYTRLRAVPGDSLTTHRRHAAS